MTSWMDSVSDRLEAGVCQDLVCPLAVLSHTCLKD